MRQKTLANKRLALAESELRVFSAIAQDNQTDVHELRNLYRNQCSLDGPYLVDAENVAAGNIGFYYSSVCLIIRSDGLVYFPGVTVQKNDNGEGDGSLDDVTDEDKVIKLDAKLLLSPGVQEQYQNRKGALKELLEKHGKSV